MNASEPRPGVTAPEMPSSRPEHRPETPGRPDKRSPDMPERPRRAEPEMPGRPSRTPEAPRDPNTPGR